MRKLEFSGALSCSEKRPAYVENETSQVTYVSASNSTDIKKERRDEKTDGAGDWSHTSLSLLRSHLHHSELVPCAA